MTYKESLSAAMVELASDPLVRFVGYGVRYGGRAAGTLKDIPEDRCIKTPVAENLMVGLAMGLAMRGLRPVVYIERFDFILNAMDAIVNHLDKIERLSKKEFNPCAILRVVAGNRDKPLFTGITHTQDFTLAIRQMVSFPVKRLEQADDILPSYRHALKMLHAHSTMLIELKDLI